MSVPLSHCDNWHILLSFPSSALSACHTSRAKRIQSWGAEWVQLQKCRSISSSLKSASKWYFPNELASVSWPLVVFLSLTHSLFAIRVDGHLLYPCHKTPPVYSCQSQSSGISLEGLTLAEKKGYYLWFAGYKNVTAMYLIDSLSCQGPKTPSPGRVYKGTPPTGKAQRKEALQRHTRTHTHTCRRTYWYVHCKCQFMSSTLPESDLLEIFLVFYSLRTQNTCHLLGH